VAKIQEYLSQTNPGGPPNRRAASGDDAAPGAGLAQSAGASAIRAQNQASTSDAQGLANVGQALQRLGSVVGEIEAQQIHAANQAKLTAAKAGMLSDLSTFSEEQMNGRLDENKNLVVPDPTKAPDAYEAKVKELKQKYGMGLDKSLRGAFESSVEDDVVRHRIDIKSKLVGRIKDNTIGSVKQSMEGFKRQYVLAGSLQRPFIYKNAEDAVKGLMSNGLIKATDAVEWMEKFDKDLSESEVLTRIARDPRAAYKWLNDPSTVLKGIDEAARRRFMDTALTEERQQMTQRWADEDHAWNLTKRQWELDSREASLSLARDIASGDYGPQTVMKYALKLDPSVVLEKVTQATAKAEKVDFELEDKYAGEVATRFDLQRAEGAFDVEDFKREYRKMKKPDVARFAQAYVQDGKDAAEKERRAKEIGAAIKYKDAVLNLTTGEFLKTPDANNLPPGSLISVADAEVARLAAQRKAKEETDKNALAGKFDAEFAKGKDGNPDLNEFLLHINDFKEGDRTRLAQKFADRAQSRSKDTAEERDAAADRALGVLRAQRAPGGPRTYNDWAPDVELKDVLKYADALGKSNTAKWLEYVSRPKETHSNPDVRFSLEQMAYDVETEAQLDQLHRAADEKARAGGLTEKDRLHVMSIAQMQIGKDNAPYWFKEDVAAIRQEVGGGNPNNRRVQSLTSTQVRHYMEEVRGEKDMTREKASKIRARLVDEGRKSLGNIDDIPKTDYTVGLRDGTFNPKAALQKLENDYKAKVIGPARFNVESENVSRATRAYYQRLKAQEAERNRTEGQ